jgi:hypothetical protein
MGAFKGNQARGQMGYGVDDGDFALVRDDSPQRVGKVYANKNQRYGEQGYGAADMAQDPIVPPGKRMKGTLGDY